MELEEMKTLWQEMSQQVEQQKKINGHANYGNDATKIFSKV